MQSTATSRYLTSWLYWASLSTKARSNDQISSLNYDLESRHFSDDSSIFSVSRFSMREMFNLFSRQIGCFYQVVHTTK